jgi:hypothetical protein
MSKLLKRGKSTTNPQGSGALTRTGGAIATTGGSDMLAKLRSDRPKPGSAIATTGDNRLAAAAEASGLSTAIGGGTVSVVFCIDGTSTMQSVINNVRRNVPAIIARATEQRVEVQAQVVIYRDYDYPQDGPDAQLETSGPLDQDGLIAFLAKISTARSGWTQEEAPEIGLEAILRMEKRPDVVFVMGDATYKEAGGNECPARGRTAPELAALLNKGGSTLHGLFYQSQWSHDYDREAFQTLASCGGGAFGALIDGENDLLDMAVMALVKAAGGARAVQQYALTYQPTGRQALEFKRGLLALEDKSDR